jgi:hypothetical protein
MLGAVNEGWRIIDLARVLDLDSSAARKRVQSARERYGDVRPALVVPEPPRPLPKAFDVLKTPVEDREWLSLAEAIACTDHSTETIKQWRRLGLLPNTDRVGPNWLLYLRADLKRVLTAPEYKRGDVDRTALLEAISTAAV